MKTQYWGPDTCKCSFNKDVTNTPHLFLDQDVIFNGFTYKNIKCSLHQALTNQEAYDAVMFENTRKNRVDGLFMDNIAALVETNPDGARVYKQGINFNWSFSGSGNNRVLTVFISGLNLTNNQKNTIQALCDSTFGTGKVVIT